MLFLLTSQKHIFQRSPALSFLLLATLHPLPPLQDLLKFRSAAQSQTP